ncbi:MAG: hypothetical protein OWV35_11600 [Firmicutes bacterium]|nr:hypothetical protein [Bacillota bacterium]
MKAGILWGMVAAGALMAGAAVGVDRYLASVQHLGEAYRSLGRAGGAAAVPASASTALTAAGQDLTRAQADATALTREAQAVSTLTGQVLQLASPAAARDPDATDPSPLEASLAQAVLRLDATGADLEAAVSAGLADDRRAGSRLTAQADANRQALQQLGDTALHLLATARGDLTRAAAAVRTWSSIHHQAPGSLGVTVADPPADWTASGCEIIRAQSGGPAAAAGLVGAAQRTDPVGDLIAAITDRSDGNRTWATPDCAAFTAAMARTRPGDRLVIHYWHRQVIWYLLSGRWVARSVALTLPGTPEPATRGSGACPPPVSGRFTSPAEGNRIPLTLILDGPAATETLPVFLDTGGVNSILPQSVLQAAGFQPVGVTSLGGVVPGATSTAYRYRIPGRDLEVLDQGQPVPLARGTLTVMGVPDLALAVVGPDVLTHGAAFSTNGSSWTLTPPCG